MDASTSRLLIFVGILVAMALLELTIPKRALNHSKSRRWFTNITMGGLNAGLIRLMALLIVPLSALAAAHYAQQHEIGLFHMLGTPPITVIIFSLFLLDFAIYLQHVASHKIPIFWKFHQVHHADQDIDVTTAVRFHPIEIGLSMLYKILWVFALGVSPLAIVLFEIMLNGCALFNHANINLPKELDRVLRLLFVTPDMHRVHHSVIKTETDSNYGFSLSLWDRFFGTYIPQPKKGHLDMDIGLSQYKDDGPTNLGWSLKLPFGKKDQP